MKGTIIYSLFRKYTYQFCNRVVAPGWETDEMSAPLPRNEELGGGKWQLQLKEYWDTEVSCIYHLVFSRTMAQYIDTFLNTHLALVSSAWVVPKSIVCFSGRIWFGT